MTRSRDELEELSECFSRLETDIESFSAALSRLSDARKGITRQRRARGPLPDLQHKKRMGDARITTLDALPRGGLGLLVLGRAEELLAGSSLGSLRFLAIVAGTATVFCLWGMRQKKRLSGAEPRSTVDATALKTSYHERTHRSACDVAFLAHPASLLSAFALWLPEDRPVERWRASWWMLPAWPFVALASVWYMFLLPRLHGPYLLADSFEYMGARNQTWLSRALGYQFMIKALRPRIARGIEATLREADKIGVSVLGLGALNKAGFINRGGEDILNTFQPRKTRLVHGNTLTAAVVVENVKAAAAAAAAAAHEAKGNYSSERCAVRPPRVFLTGATSKVGRAVALTLALDGYDVVCCTSSDERFDSLQQELELLQRKPATSACSNRNETFHFDGSRSGTGCGGRTSRLGSGNREVKGFPWGEATGFATEGEGSPGRGRLLRASRVDEGVHYRLWVVGKCDTSVRLHMPLGASAVVFAVPCPLDGHRPDVSAVPGGIVRMDVSRCTPRRFHILLPFDQLYACHAAALVHHQMKWTHHEVGEVDIRRMASILEAARECGFAISFRRDPLTTAIATGTAATATPPLPVEDEALDVDRRHTRADVVGGGQVGSSRKARLMTGYALSATAAVRCSGSAGNDEGQRGAMSVSLPRPEGVLHGVNRPHSVAGSGGLASPPETRDFGYGLSQTSPDGCHGRDFRGGGEEGVSEIAAAIPANNGVVVEASDFSQAVSRTLQASRDGTAVAIIEGAVSRTREGGDLSVMGSPHAEGFPAAAEREDERGAVGVSVSREGPPSPSFCRVVIVGAGASGLSAAACLKARGEAGVLILEKSKSVSGGWSGQYEGLRITTRRTHCGLPGWPVPREGFCAAGSSDISAPSFIRYLRGYRRRFDLDVFFETEVIWAEREALFTQGYGDAPVAGCIRVQFRRGGSISVIRCEHLVIATGKNAIPRMPPEVIQSLQGYSGEVIHSSRVKNLAARARGWRICIVGMGNSACDLAVALLEHGAEKVHISTRSVPPIIMRQWGPLSLEWMARAVQYLPARVNDHILTLFAAAKWGKGWRATVFPPQLEQTWSPCADGRVPCIDKGCLVPALKDGRIAVRGPIDWANGQSLRFKHSGTVGPFETVILATGFDSAHQVWLHPRLLEEGAGGVHMVGFNNGRALLPLKQIGADSRRVASHIAPRRFPDVFTRSQSRNGSKRLSV